MHGRVFLIESQNWGIMCQAWRGRTRRRLLPELDHLSKTDSGRRKAGIVPNGLHELL